MLLPQADNHLQTLSSHLHKDQSPLSLFHKPCSTQCVCVCSYACILPLDLALLYSLSFSIWMWCVFSSSFWFSTMSRGRQILPASV